MQVVSPATTSDGPNPPCEPGASPAIRKHGDQLALTLGPVEITDIVRDGFFQLDQLIDLDDTLVFEVPDWPVAAVPAASEAPVTGRLSSSSNRLIEAKLALSGGVSIFSAVVR